MQTVYILKSRKDDNWYIGCTSDVDERIKMHNTGRVRATKGRVPFELVYTESYENRYEAFRMERFYKTAKGKRALKKKIWGVV